MQVSLARQGLQRGSALKTTGQKIVARVLIFMSLTVENVHTFVPDVLLDWPRLGLNRDGYKMVAVDLAGQIFELK